jgi:hypothetical protein
MKTKLGPRFLTVVLRDIAPMVHLNEPVNHRSVRIELTENQRKILSLNNTHTIGGIEFYENISLAILEEE